tara:strand:- start:246 stop:512 length:267 start_codon:yes stop_codon:yes gene_type:complete
MNDLNTQNPFKKRFTFLIESKLLSQIKLISYFTNQKLNETINKSISDYINNFETQSNTKLDSLIDLQSNFQTLPQTNTNPIPTKNNKK